MKTINVLGTEYTVKFQTEKDNPKLKGNDGLFELYTQEIILDLSNKNEPTAYANVEAYYDKVFRHELFHAIFAEAGLMDYCNDEILINALATLYPKIQKIMEKAKVFDFLEGEKDDRR